MKPAVNGPEVRGERVLFVAIVFVLLSTPQVIDVFRMLPVLIPLLFVSGHVLAPKREQLLVTRVPILVVGLGLWLWATSVWSDGTSISLIQCLATTLVLAVAVLIGCHCTLREILKGLIVGGLVVLALSLAVAALDPSTGLMPAGYQGGTLRGIYVHRNLLAEILTLPIVASLAFEFTRPFALGKRLLCFLPLVGGVLLTRSSTALSAVIAAIVLAVVFAFVRRFTVSFRIPLLFLAFGGIGGAFLAIVAHPAIVYALLQRDATLTGRTLIWTALRRLIADRPVQGYGWGAVWGVGEPARNFVESVAKFEVPSAHNGYLDVWLQAGLVGLILFLVLIATVLFPGLRHAVRSRSTEMTWGPLYVVSLLIYNVAEASLVSNLCILLLAVSAVQRPALPLAGAVDSGPRAA